MTKFPAFFESLWRNDKWRKPEPFPWQTMLAERGARGDWPEAINLPTASGKTACLDAAIFVLAATADLPAIEKRMPRRIWFVVDRRIVVDEAYQRARQIADKLAGASESPVREIAERLRAVAGTKQPLAVARLRGGAWRDDGWARLPSQPAIICSTVDQVGSALLFRAYGHGGRTASIYAGLAANDSLILLDEAHCAVPFLQTLRAVARFRGEQWVAQPLKTPFRFSVMSATPPADIRDEASFPKATERIAALNHPLLLQRFSAGKATALVPPLKDEKFVGVAATYARGFAEAHPEDIGRLIQGFDAGRWAARFAEGKPRVAVMVNRVATTEQITENLRGKDGDSMEIVLLTGRMRPLDRDDLVKNWEDRLKAGTVERLHKPVIVVTTQCLEVGADFSFDALVTECASLDALRQRFGRLDRLGTLGESPAVILIREGDAKESKDEDGDPIYGRAIHETWKWLNEPHQRNPAGTVDFGVESMSALLGGLREHDEKRFKSLLAPTSDAPILLPAHLDLFCQTSPRPTPDPDVTLFLHGKDRGAPEVRVVFRVDLTDGTGRKETQEEWLDILSVIPPTSPEMLTVPLYRLRRWLSDAETDDVGGDVEGARDDGDQGRDSSAQSARVPFLIWRGRDASRFSRNFNDIRPDDVVVLRLDGNGLRGLGQSPDPPSGAGVGRLDLAERALRQARGRVVLRIQRDVLAPWLSYPAVKSLLDVEISDAYNEEIKAALQTVLDEASETKELTGDTPSLDLPEWLKNTIKKLIEDDFGIEDHPVGGRILIGKKRRFPIDTEFEDDPLGDQEDLTSKNDTEVTLRNHTAAVHREASNLVTRCLSPELTAVFIAAAVGHDLGKVDQRFQIMLRNGVEYEVGAEPLAKSEWLPERRRRRLEIREDFRLPEGFRHEFLSLQLAERFGFAPSDADSRGLALHLIASHHGYARPFAPVWRDEDPPGISVELNGCKCSLTGNDRRRLAASCRLDSGVADRFWQLTRRYGWWGLAYLEAIFRLADWEASRKAETNLEKPSLPQLGLSAAPPQPNLIALDGLDGANPLAFLAALGTLRMLTRCFPEHRVALSWSQRLGAWRPLLSTIGKLDEETMLVALHDAGLRLDTMFSPHLLAASETAGPKNKRGEPRWRDKLLFPVDALRVFCETTTATPSFLADYSATWAGETALIGEEGERVARRTRFDFTAGQQAFIRMLRELRESCTMEDLRHSLLTGWRYSAAAVSMRWDTQDEKRQYALQAFDPTDGSDNPPVAELGANFLAAEALPLFPMVPNRSASQAGFDSNAEGRCWRWPIWTAPLGLDSIRSLLALPLADSEQWPSAHRRAVGVPVVFESRIVQPSGRYRCFTPSRSL